MRSRLNPYISFAGDAREAMEFYKSVFGGNLSLNTFGEYGAPDPSIADKVMHALLETDSNFALMPPTTRPAWTTTPGRTSRSA